MPTTPERPPALHPPAQVLLGLIIGLSLVGLATLTALLGLPITRYAWLAIFLTLYAATYVSLKTRLRLLIATAIITLLVTGLATLAILVPLLSK